MNEQMVNNSTVMQTIKKEQFWILKLKTRISEIKFQCIGVIRDGRRKNKKAKNGTIHIMCPVPQREKRWKYKLTKPQLHVRQYEVVYFKCKQSFQRVKEDRRGQTIYLKKKSQNIVKFHTCFQEFQQTVSRINPKKIITKHIAV